MEDWEVKMSSMFYEYRRDLARSRGFIYRSPEDYQGDKCEWQCRHKGHGFTMSWKDVVNDPYILCPKCAGKELVRRRGPQPWRNKYQPEHYEAKAAEHGGVCVIPPTGLLTYGLWRCAKGHEFRMRSITAMEAGGWCPECRVHHRRPSTKPKAPEGGRVKLSDLMEI